MSAHPILFGADLMAGLCAGLGAVVAMPLAVAAPGAVFAALAATGGFFGGLAALGMLGLAVWREVRAIRKDAAEAAATAQSKARAEPEAAPWKPTGYPHP